MPSYRTRGHVQALAFIRRMVEAERSPHALLLVGRDRVGKTTLALDLARGLLCLAEDPASRPCAECAACRKVDHGNHPDLHRLAPQGAGGQIRLGQVQALAAELALLPLEGRCRLAIIERAQRLNLDAQNALLKTLEEPPAAVVIVLAADDTASLLPTVVSRCARLRLGPLPTEVLSELLQQAAGVDPVRAEQLARLAGGRPGTALAVAANPEALIARDRLARTLLGLLEADRRSRLAAQAELLEDGALLASLVSNPTDDSGDEADEGASPKSRRQTPAERRAATSQVLGVWREVTRDLALAARGAGRELALRELVGELGHHAPRLPASAWAAFLGRLEALERAVEAYANPELLLDALLLAWPRAPGQGRESAA